MPDCATCSCNRALRVALSILTLVLAGCATPVRTSVDLDPTADFQAFRTYSWKDEGVRAAESAEPWVGPLVLSRIRAEIDHTLQARGFRRESPGDFLVTAVVGMRDEFRVRPFGAHVGGTFGRGFHGYRYGGPFIGFHYDPFFPHVRMVRETEVTIAIDIFDHDSAAPVWRGRADEVLVRDDLRSDTIRAMVTAILAQFPPEPAILPQASRRTPVEAP